MRVFLVGLLDLDVVLEQARHLAALAGAVAGGHARGIERVDLARGEHRRQSLRGADRLHADVRRQVELQLLVAPRLLLAAGVIAHRIDRHAVLVLQDAADPGRRGHLVLGTADLPADQVLRRADACRSIHIYAAMTKHARREHRDRDKRPLGPRERNRVGRERHLGDVELAVAQHAKEGLLDRQVAADQVDSVGLHAAVEERLGAIVVPAGERQFQLGQGPFLREKAFGCVV